MAARLNVRAPRRRAKAPTEVFTVLGASGFIGSHLLRSLAAASIPSRSPGRGEDLRGEPLGHVVYCIGLTADFRSRPADTVEAHVVELHRLLGGCRFDSLTYLSSTRLYRRALGYASEESRILVNPLDGDDLYNISKAMGESLVLAVAAAPRVVRLSNVYGADFRSENFLTSVITQAVREGRVVLHSALASEKDYVHVGDVVDLLPRIAMRGRMPMYNVAAGVNVSHAELMEALAALTGCDVEVDEGAPVMTSPSISVARAAEEFGYRPRRVLDDLPELVERYRARLGMAR